MEKREQEEEDAEGLKYQLPNRKKTRNEDCLTWPASLIMEFN